MVCSVNEAVEQGGSVAEQSVGSVELNQISTIHHHYPVTENIEGQYSVIGMGS